MNPTVLPHPAHLPHITLQVPLGGGLTGSSGDVLAMVTLNVTVRNHGRISVSLTDDVMSSAVASALGLPVDQVGGGVGCGWAQRVSPSNSFT